jgi:hypothetical protein
MRTDLDIGAENPETAVVSGFCYAIFQSMIKKISFLKKRPLGRDRTKIRKELIFLVSILRNMSFY